MANNSYVIRGTLHWAKLLGEPRMNEYSGTKQWSVDVTPDAAGRKLLEELGLTGKLKEPKATDNRKESFLSFRQNESRIDKKTGEVKMNQPVTIKDVRGESWPKDKLLGNGTVADVKFQVVDYGKQVQKGTYIQAVRVLSHVPYESEEFAPLSEDDEFFASENDVDMSSPDMSQAPADEDMDDVPF